MSKMIIGELLMHNSLFITFDRYLRICIKSGTKLIVVIRKRSKSRHQTVTDWLAMFKNGGRDCSLLIRINDMNIILLNSFNMAV